MSKRILISFLAVLLFGIASSYTFIEKGEDLEANAEKVELSQDQESEEGEEEIAPSPSFEAVFQVFNFSPRSWVFLILDFQVVNHFVPAAAEFLIRDFMVPDQLILFRQIISKNAP